ncbi:hypothetical protein EVAR_82133_1 [Eumeta japonica]|uniref:Uncharacterized protein n=1 Tax=Eumeta variegata TaxID=151549 RepID=A0A4C1U1X5_EUMVA|nr:hypothetical protein EVAR_82133_1 [Eumeta japonica]
MLRQNTLFGAYSLNCASILSSLTKLRADVDVHFKIIYMKPSCSCSNYRAPPHSGYRYEALITQFAGLGVGLRVQPYRCTHKDLFTKISSSSGSVVNNITNVELGVTIEGADMQKCHDQYTPVDTCNRVCRTDDKAVLGAGGVGPGAAERRGGSYPWALRPLTAGRRSKYPPFELFCTGPARAHPGFGRGRWVWVGDGTNHELSQVSRACSA